MKVEHKIERNGKNLIHQYNEKLKEKRKKKKNSTVGTVINSYGKINETKSQSDTPNTNIH